MSSRPAKITLPRDYDYAALAKHREKAAMRTLDPVRKASLQLAARYARRRAAESAYQHSGASTNRASAHQRRALEE